MSLQDALYNWLSIKVVCDARPDDQAARNTFQLFDKILKDEHQVETVLVTINEEMYIVDCEANGKDRSMKFPVELIEFMLVAIDNEKS